MEPYTPSTSARRCTACGVVSDDVCLIGRRSRRCLRCRARDEEKVRKIAVALLASVGLTGLVLFVAGFDDLFSVTIQISLGLALAIAVAVWPHELAHALAARLLGFRVFTITVGLGRPLFSCSLGKTRLDVRTLPSGAGAVYAAPRSLTLFRSRFFLFVLAGPLANVLLAFWCYRMLQAKVLGFTFLGAPATILAMLFLAGNFLVALISLTPHRFQMYGQMVRSDGLLLIITPFTSRVFVTDNYISYFLREGDICSKEGRHEEAREWYRRARELYPDHIGSILGIGVTLFYAGRFEEARIHLKELLAREGHAGDTRASLLNALVHMNLSRLLRDPELSGVSRADLLREADAACTEAFRLALTMPTLLTWAGAMRGAIRVEQGRLREAEAWLEFAGLRGQDRSVLVFRACYLALAAAREGRSSDRERHLREARRWDPAYFGLEDLIRNSDRG